MQRKKKKIMSILSEDNLAAILKKSKNDVQRKKIENNLSDIIGENNLTIIEGPNTINKKYGEIEWVEIKDKRHGFDQPIELWNKQKLFSYFRYKCKKINIRYADAIDCAIGLARRHVFIKEIFQTIEKSDKDLANNNTVRNYIDYFVQNILATCVTSSGEFDVYQLIRKQNILKFLRVIKNIKQQSSTFKASNCTTSIDDVYDTGGINLLKTYGIVVSFVYLCKMRQIDETRACKVIIAFYNDASKDSTEILDTILQKTLEYGPYCKSYYSVALNDAIRNTVNTNIDFVLNGKLFFKETN